MEKRKTTLVWVLAVILFCTTVLFAWLYFSSNSSGGGNYTDEMKIDHSFDYEDYGADDVERTGDCTDSEYFSSIDFYNAESTDSLSILTHFKTIQQTSWWSCGVCATMMALDYYDALGDWTEETLADLRSDHSELHDGTCLDQIIEMLEGASDLTFESTYDYDNLDDINGAWIKKNIDAGYPIIVGWNDWGGHWQVIIGYDTMGTEDYEGDDVIIVADSYDTTDHNQDGYGVYGMERFIYNFTFYDFFPDDHQADKCFVVVKP